MDNHINIPISKEIKEIMLAKKDELNESFTKQIDTIFSGFLALSIEEKNHIIKEFYSQYKNADIETITVIYFDSLDELKELYYLLKIRTPKLTFKQMLFSIFQYYFHC